MAKISLYLDTRRPLKSGAYPLKIQVFHCKQFFIPLGIELMEEQWDGEQVLLPNRIKTKNVNDFIENRLLQVRSIIQQLQLQGKLKKLDDKALKAIIIDGDAAATGNKAGVLLVDHFASYMDTIESKSNRDTYLHTLNKIREYAADTDSLLVSGIDKDWVRGFDKFMDSAGLAHNTRLKYLQNLRAVIYDAMERELVLMRNPFLKYKMPKYRANKRPLTIAQLQALRDFPCESHHEKYRDIFMLIFYLGGINMIDLSKLTEIKNGRIEYYRSKTGIFCSLRVEPEAQAIINKYRGQEHLLCFFDNRKNYKDFEGRMNEQLKKIGPYEMVESKNRRKNKKEYTPLVPGLSTYYARHTVATIASELDIPDKTIGMLLGHSDASITNKYITFNYKKIDEANRKILDAIL